LRAPLILVLGAVLGAGAGCGGGGAGGGVLIDPDAVGSDQGTLISIADIRTVAEEMITSMNQSRQLERLRDEKKPLRIAIGEIKQRTSITIFDKNLFLNRLLGRLSAADIDGDYAFLRREAVAEERRLQEEGTVATGGLPPLGGADLVLSGEVRELLHREAAPGGGELQKRTVQYTLALDAVADGRRIWIHPHEIVKQQIVGALYQ
jgi:hypothetical protein